MSAAIPTRKAVDPVTLRVLGGAFTAVAKEMAHVIFRTAAFSLIREAEDLGAAVLDAAGREIAESETTCMHCGSIGAYVRGVLERHRDTIEPGDVFLHNHPYHGATHSADFAICAPIFSGGELVAWAANTAHLADNGGSTPGLNVDAFDVYAEGRLYNAVRLFSRGARNDELWNHIFENVRTPDLNRGDLEALLASAQLGVRRFSALLDKYGAKTVLAAASEWMDYCERMLRAEIAKVPDGEYAAPVQYLDDDGRNRERTLNVNLKVVIAGDELTIDLTGSHPQVETAFNASLEGATKVAAYSIVRMIFLDQARFPQFLPHNEGMFRPIRVVAPRGSIFNPTFPHACFSRFMQCQLLCDSVYLALAPVIPRFAVAGSGAEVHVLALSGLNHDTEDYWVYIGVRESSWGGRFGKDGLDAVGCLMCNTRNSPVEDDEWRYPIRHERYELREGAPAPGTWRGGLGTSGRIRILADSWVSSEAERHVDSPKGIFGGLDGRPGSIRLVRPGSDVSRLPSKFSGRRLAAGDVIEIDTACGGGYGTPLGREPAAVVADVLDGFVSRREALEIYGVALSEDGRGFNGRTTAERRRALAAADQAEAPAGNRGAR